MRKDFVVGADISWYPQMRKDGFVFRDKEGRAAPLLDTLKGFGFTAVRLRTWVNPVDHDHAGHCSAPETLALAQECQAAGYQIMIDFHYSDSWADPQQQRKPTAWAGLAFEQLEKQVYAYTRETLQMLADGGVRVQWAQIGNEINPGMLLPDGSAEDFGKLSGLISAGHDGVKDVSPQTLTMVHLAEFNKTDFVIHYFDQLALHRCRYDMMGFSFYPYHLPDMTREECARGFVRSMKEIPERFERDLMIVETGERSDDEALTEQLLRFEMAEALKQPYCKGIMLWEPEGAACWSHYPLSAWRDDGVPSSALSVFGEALHQ